MFGYVSVIFSTGPWLMNSLPKQRGRQVELNQRGFRSLVSILAKQIIILSKLFGFVHPQRARGKLRRKASDIVRERIVGKSPSPMH